MPQFSAAETHLLLVSHGMLLREFVNAVCDMAMVPRRWIKMGNTAITTFRLVPVNTSVVNGDGDVAIAVGGDVAPPLPLARFRVEFMMEGDVGHLNNLVRQKGRIGSAAYDLRQKKLSSFFERTGIRH